MANRRPRIIRLASKPSSLVVAKGILSHPTRRLRKHFARHEVLLTDVELGEEDVGMAAELGQVKACDVHATQKVGN